MKLEELKNRYLDIWDIIEKRYRENQKVNIESLGIILKDNETFFDIKEK